MLILGLGLKAKFLGLGLVFGTVRPWFWPYMSLALDLALVGLDTYGVVNIPDQWLRSQQD